MSEKYDGSAYCPKCHVSREFKGIIVSTDSGRHMAVGACFACKTVLRRLLAY